MLPKWYTQEGSLSRNEVVPGQGKAAQFPDSRPLSGHETFQFGQGGLDPIFLRLFAVLLLSSTTPPQLHASGLRDKDIARMVRFQMRVNHGNSFYEARKLIHMAASDSESQLGEIAAQRGAHQRSPPRKWYTKSRKPFQSFVKG
jgi:hypothetical protein